MAEDLVLNWELGVDGPNVSLMCLNFRSSCFRLTMARTEESLSPIQGNL